MFFIIRPVVPSPFPFPSPPRYSYDSSKRKEHPKRWLWLYHVFGGNSSAPSRKWGGAVDGPMIGRLQQQMSTIRAPPPPPALRQRNFFFPPPSPASTQLSLPAHVRRGQLSFRVELNPPESKYVGGGGVFLGSMGRTITPGLGSGLVLPAKLRRVVSSVCVCVSFTWDVVGRRTDMVRTPSLFPQRVVHRTGEYVGAAPV